ncbi:glycosyltransferase [bacterium]|nr:glycosyltransferase [bacterium]
METTLFTVFILSAVLTALGFVFIYLGWRRALRIPPQSTRHEEITVVVAAHNEAARIPRLLASLAAQRFPKELLHVLVVDDRSEDGTAAVVERATGALQLRLLRIDSVPDDVSPKKFALHRGISEAQTDIVLLTDADCEAGEEWAGAMLRTLQRGNDVAAGLAPLRSTRYAHSAYSSFDACRTLAMMSAATAWGVPYMATGRSWGFRREAYERCGGLEPLFGQLGGDDDLLLQRMHAQGARIGMCIEQDAMVWSSTPASWRALLRQKLRHYRVGASYQGRGAWLLGIFLGVELLTVLTGLILIAVLPGMQKLLPPIFIVWTLWYATGFLVAPFKWMDAERSRIQLVKWEAFHIFYSVIVSLLSHIRPSRW